MIARELSRAGSKGFLPVGFPFLGSAQFEVFSILKSVKLRLAPVPDCSN